MLFLRVSSQGAELVHDAFEWQAGNHRLYLLCRQLSQYITATIVFLCRQVGKCIFEALGELLLIKTFIDSFITWPGKIVKEKTLKL